MLFKSTFHAGIQDGSTTLSFRRWKRPQVKVGNQYTVGRIGLIRVIALNEVSAGSITTVDAHRSGFPTSQALKRVLAHNKSADAHTYRVAFRYLGPDLKPQPPTDANLTPSELNALHAKLDAMDARSKHGPWTRQVLQLIDAQPQVAASKLAPQLNRETQSFKTPAFKEDVRKLKRLGLTISHDVGYELSPRGRLLLD